MPKIDVYDIEGKKVNDVELNEDIFGIEKCHKINEEYRKQEEISTWQRSVKICL